MEWDNPGGTREADVFDEWIKDRILKEDYNAVIRYQDGPYASYAVPTPDHFLPLLYALGASDGDAPVIFNNVRNLGSIAMTGYVFGLQLRI